MILSSVMAGWKSHGGMAEKKHTPRAHMFTKPFKAETFLGGSQLDIPYLEDHPSSKVVNKHGPVWLVSPYLGGVGPLPNGRTPWLIHGGYMLTTYCSWGPILQVLPCDFEDSEVLYTLEDFLMEPTNHPWKERNMIWTKPPMIKFHVNLQGCRFSFRPLGSPKISHAPRWPGGCDIHWERTRFTKVSHGPKKPGTWRLSNGSSWLY